MNLRLTARLRLFSMRFCPDSRTTNAWMVIALVLALWCAVGYYVKCRDGCEPLPELQDEGPRVLLIQK